MPHHRAGIDAEHPFELARGREAPRGACRFQCQLPPPRLVPRQLGDRPGERGGIGGGREQGRALPQLAEGRDVRQHQRGMLGGGFQHREPERLVARGGREDGGAAHQSQQRIGRQLADRLGMPDRDQLAVRTGARAGHPHRPRRGSRRQVEDRGVLALVPPPAGRQHERLLGVVGRQRRGRVVDHRKPQGGPVRPDQRGGVTSTRHQHAVGPIEPPLVAPVLPGPSGRQRLVAHGGPPARHAGMRGDQHGQRRFEPRRLRRQVEMQQVGLPVACQGRQGGRYGFQRGLAVGHPVQRLVGPDQFGARQIERPGRRPVIGARPEPHQQAGDAVLVEPARQVDGIAPHPADRIDGHQHPARTSHRTRQQPASRWDKGAGRSSWISLKAENARR